MVLKEIYEQIYKGGVIFYPNSSYKDKTVVIFVL